MRWPCLPRAAAPAWALATAQADASQVITAIQGSGNVVVFDAAADNHVERGLFVTTRAVPAPGSLPLALAALVGLGWVTRRPTAHPFPRLHRA